MGARGEIYWGVVDSILYISPIKDNTYAKTLFSQTSSSTNAPWSSLTTYTKVCIYGGELNVFTCQAWFKGRTKITNVVALDDTPAIDQLPSGTRSWGTITNCASIKEMFSGCTALQTIDGAILKSTEYLTDASNAFYNCSALTYYSLFDDYNDEEGIYWTVAPNLTTTAHMYDGCTVLDDFFDCDLWSKNITDMSYMFRNCTRYDGFHYPSETSNVTTMAYMYYGCTGLDDQIDFLFKWDTSKVTTMQSMFQNCSNIVKLYISNFDATSLTNISSMFNGCSKLETIYIKSSANWNISTITSSSTVFTGCTALVGGNGTRYSSSNVTKTYARVDSSSTPGYFTGVICTVSLNKSGTGDGSATNLGTYDFGTTVNIYISPDGNSYISRIDGDWVNGASYYSEYEAFRYRGNDTLIGRTYTLKLIADLNIKATFGTRGSYSVLVTQPSTDYTIQGQGTYRYLDNPTLIIDLNEASISFYGWYNNDELVSVDNPYSFTMPNSDYILEARFTDSPFSNEKVRQFILLNGNGEVRKLTSHDSNMFLSSPSGLGYVKNVSLIRFGNTSFVAQEQFEMPKPKGTLFFHDSDLSKNYKDYQNFVKFSLRKPFTLWYKIPLSDENMTDIFHIPVEVTTIEKTETDEHGSIISGIEFEGTEFWKYTQYQSSASSQYITVLNNGDLDSGVELTVSKTNNTQFSDPVITFTSINTDGSTTLYGKCAIEGTYSKLYLNTKDSLQKIRLYNGDDEVTDAFSHIDFSAADGVATFPYPKIKAGLQTKIEFTYQDHSDEDTKSFVVLFDEEYVSV